eukprot:CAMPEP_0178895790 /NCGR_PEP_ID=MMETSP0786-20121207/785_1 /TAXON_ID=186022 /ORGANISM="Thalassionema frauenfeldii, Strain CCMP 1798" /LENGTH=302 /DNA_ID=CAMNT_0020566065 /DNA_START=260 /DNA_END=1165 /DNA_ORIENTATION=-
MSSTKKDDMLTTCLDAARTSILSIGSGDGSQQKAIVEQGHNKILTTFYENSKNEVLRKYPHAASILNFLEQKSYRLPLYGMDATQLHSYNIGKFDIILFTFPHTGVPNNQKHSIRSNQELLRNFLQSAQHVLTPNGQVQVTLKKGEFYEKWNISSLLEENGTLNYKGSHDLDKSMFPGYVHRLTKGSIGSMKQVVDKQGAQVHVFSDVMTIGKTKSVVVNSNKHTVIVAPPVGMPMTDVEIQAQIMSVLGQRLQDVLEIRRSFDDPKPDTRQLNRILYSMKEQGFVQQHGPKPGGTNKKPRW